MNTLKLLNPLSDKQIKAINRLHKEMNDWKSTQLALMADFQSKNKYPDPYGNMAQAYQQIYSTYNSTIQTMTSQIMYEPESIDDNGTFIVQRYEKTTH